MQNSFSTTNLAISVVGDGRPVVFVNGFGSYKEIWTAQVAAFSRGVQTVCFDYHGQGESAGVMATNLEQLAADLAHVIRQQKLVRPLLVGHSMGASVIWAMRRQYPELMVSGIMVVDQSPKMINDAQWRYGYRGLTARTATVQLQQPRQGHETLRGMVPAVTDAFIRAESHRPFDREQGMKLLSDHFQADWRAQIVAERAPVLFVTAAQTPYFNNGYGQWLSSRNPQVHEVMIQNCGHDVMAEVPDSFNQTLRHFMLQNK